MRIISRTTFYFLLFVFVLAGAAMVMIYRIVEGQQIYHAILPKPAQQSQKAIVIDVEKESNSVDETTTEDVEPQTPDTQ